MDCLILNGNPEASGFEHWLDQFGGSLSAQGHQVTRIDLRSLELNYCTGCWSCWWKTPGHCMFKDGMQTLYPLMAKADLVVWASPLVLGTVSSLTKRAQDRFIPLVHPYLILSDGECHHRHRYAKNADVALVFEPDPADTPEDLAIATEFWHRFARNTRTRLRAAINTQSTSAQEAAHAID